MSVPERLVFHPHVLSHIADMSQTAGGVWIVAWSGCVCCVDASQLAAQPVITEIALLLCRFQQTPGV